jgi:uncharacterized membrane protein YfcA
MRILQYLVLGGAIGTVSGALGIGGGVLLIPLLMWMFDFDFLHAAGTTLAVLAVPVTLPGAIQAYQKERVNLEAAFFLAIAFAAGCYLGASIVRPQYAPMLRFVFGLLLVFVAARFLLSTDSHAAAASAGLIAAVLAWVLFLVMRAMGRRHLRPTLADHIRHEAEKGRGEGDYQI